MHVAEVFLDGLCVMSPTYFLRYATSKYGVTTHTVPEYTKRDTVIQSALTPLLAEVRHGGQSPTVLRSSPRVLLLNSFPFLL